MLHTMDANYCKTVDESMIHITAVEAIANNMIRVDLSELVTKVKEAPLIEYPDNYFTKQNLINSNYTDISYKDFEKFFNICCLQGMETKGREILKSVLNDSVNFTCPILLKGMNNIYWQFIGNIEMMAYKVLGIFPLIKEISIEANISK